MNYILLCLLVFSAAYLLNIFYITVFYHRGLTHSAVTLRPWARTLVIHTGNWITGLDPKAWACMHRLHHEHSDTKDDPHSPWNLGVFGLLPGQLRAYKRIIAGIELGRKKYTSVIEDLKFEINWLNRKNLWYLPYVLHAAVGLGIAIVFQTYLLGFAYWLGMMSHPIQGWMVNSFAHKYGYTNFKTGDRSKNNTLVAWLVFGEGFQNNHHAHPASAKFSFKWFEFDFGYALCRIAQTFGVLSINRSP